MLSCSSRALRLPRSGGFASPATVRAAARRPVRQQIPGARFQSSTSGGPTPTSQSHLASGVAGGATVIVAGYVIYYFSDLRKTVQVAKSAKVYLQQTKDQVSSTISEKLSSSSTSSMVQQPNEAVRYLRNLTLSYVAIVPGMSSYVDTTFDALEKIAEEHADEARQITQGAYDDIQKVVKESKSKSGDLSDVGPEAAFKVLEVIRRRTAELYELGKKAGGSAVDEVLERHPQVKEKLGGGYEQLKGLAESRGPEAKKVLDEVSNKVQDIVKKGPNADNLSELANYIREKTDQVRKMAEPAAQEAWDKALSSASPYLDKLPEIRQLLDEKKSTFLALGAGALGGKGSGLTELFDKAKEVADLKDEKQRKEKMQKLKDFVLKKAEEAQDKAQSYGGDIAGQLSWGTVESYVKSLPGGEQMLEKAPNARALLELSKDKGDDAAKLAKETWEEVLKVMEDKGKKARELAKDTKEEGKQKAKD